MSKCDKEARARTKKKREPLVPGLYARELTLPWDSKDQFEDLHGRLKKEFSPNGAAEEETLLDLANLFWKKRTLWRMTQAAILADANLLGIGNDCKTWSDVRKEAKERARDDESFVGTALAQFKDIRANMVELMVEIRRSSDREETKDLNEKLDHCMRLLKKYVAPYLQMMNTIPNSEKALNNIYDAANLEKMLRVEAMLDARISKALARLVGLKEFKLTPAAAAVPQLESQAGPTGPMYF